MKTRRCNSAVVHNRRGNRPLIDPGEILSERDSVRANLSLEHFRQRFRGGDQSNSNLHLFKSLDFDGDGYLTFADILNVVKHKDLPLTELDCRSLMGKLDKKRTGSVNLCEFLESLSLTGSNFLDQMQRTIVGVKRGGGTVYRKVHPLRSASSARSEATTASSFMSITGAIQANVFPFRAPSGRLTNLYEGLVVPQRNLPWEDYTKHTVQPCEWLPDNPQLMSDSTRHFTTSMMMQDTVSRPREELKKPPVNVRMSHDALTRAAQKEMVAEDLDLRRVAFKSAALMDYHDRVGRKYCHVAD